MTDRRCLQCSAPLVKSPVESARYFARKLFCSNACSAAHRRGAETNPFLTYPELPILPGEELTHREIAELLDLSHTRVQQIERQALSKLRGAYGADGGGLLFGEAGGEVSFLGCTVEEVASG